MKYLDLRKALKKPLFTKQDLRLLGVKIFDYQLSLWQKHGHITKIKNGLYVLTDSISRISPEEIAGKLYGPSYVSLEKALAHYGIIPEMVYSITCITPKTTRRFKNKLGNFIYRHLKPTLFFGYRQVKGSILPYLLAGPEKAFLDFIYLNPAKFKTADDLKEMRLNRELLNISKLRSYLASYKNGRMNSVCKKLTKK